MDLPVSPPVAPMLARLVGEIPEGAYAYEPKWDGFRAIVFADRGEIEIGSRGERPMTRYFPELVAAAAGQFPRRCVVDGEIVVPAADGRRLDFEALLQRIHPARSRVATLAARTPAHFVAFDLLAIDDLRCTGEPFQRRRELLVAALAGARPPIHLTPATTDHAVAQDWFAAFEGAGLDGIVAKSLAGTYQQGKRVMCKIKHERTADCVVAGYRPHTSSAEAVGSLLLGLYTPTGELASVGVTGAFTAQRRRELFGQLQPLVTTFDGHPWDWGGRQAAARVPQAAQGSRWNAGKDLSFVPLRPERVAEVRYDHMEGDRFRHTTQFVRWRPDRDPASCTYEQLEQPVSYDLAEVFRSGAGGRATDRV